ncbi:hypothetical protein AVEN_56508-1 [Araneus ventricosus]|uniref:Uncharacterized protein n=1 Tax=Araneus ventricosus TaxID=182803 RepID=A0A4Y2G253_ARAVE|nr:hypothetical protein AVEN_56508-1 [Araneus ventricosus]
MVDLTKIKRDSTVVHSSAVLQNIDKRSIWTGMKYFALGESEPQELAIRRFISVDLQRCVKRSILDRMKSFALNERGEPHESGKIPQWFIRCCSKMCEALNWTESEIFYIE